MKPISVKCTWWVTPVPSSLPQNLRVDGVHAFECVAAFDGAETCVEFCKPQIPDCCKRLVFYGLLVVPRQPFHDHSPSEVQEEQPQVAPSFSVDLRMQLLHRDTGPAGAGLRVCMLYISLCNANKHNKQMFVNNRNCQTKNKCTTPCVPTSTWYA